MCRRKPPPERSGHAPRHSREAAPKSMSLVSVIIPTYNEAINLPALYERLCKVAETLHPHRFEFLFVDDRSTDETQQLLAGFREHDKRVRAVRFSKNFGSHAACLAGMQHARGELMTIIAADLQDPPELMGEMLAKIEAGADVVFAYRSQREDPRSKVFFSNIYHRLMRKYAMPNWPAQGADVVMMRRSVSDVLVRWRQKNTSLFAQMVWTGFRQEFIPYTKEKRRAGKSKWNLARKIKLAVDSFASFSFTPIRFMSYMGALVSATGFVYAGMVIYRRLVHHITVEGFASLMVVVLVLGGFQLLMLGILGEYLWRVADEVRGSPAFIIDATLGIDEERGWAAYLEEKQTPAGESLASPRQR